MSAELLLGPQGRGRLEAVLRKALEETKSLEGNIQKALVALEALEQEDRALGLLYASIPRLGHKVLEEILLEIQPRLVALCHPLQEVLEEVSAGRGEGGA